MRFWDGSDEDSKGQLSDGLTDEIRRNKAEFIDCERFFNRNHSYFIRYS